jgi:DUF1680 family protein
MDLRRRELLLAGALLAPALPSRAAAAPAPAGPQPFALGAVRLHDGPFRRAQALGSRYLLSLDPDRLLSGFRANAGLAPRAPRYGGWESQVLCPGHTLGHYLSACAAMWASTGEPALRERVNHVVDELHDCQQAARSGLVCAFPDGDTQLRNALAGRPVTGVPWYTMHKIMAGLRDAHLHAAHPRALPALARLGDWMVEAADGIDDARFQRMLEIEHGGMNEVLADLHVLTGDPRYLQLARRFDHRALLDPLADGRDTLDGLHSNTQIPKVIGFARLAAITGDERHARAARHFWGDVVRGRSFATGGNGDGEYFFAPADTVRHLGSAKTMETCCTHNMLRLTRALFTAEPSAEYADYQERALFNGILASQDPDSGMVTYFQATRPGYPKLYCTPQRSFWCCTGTGMENFARLGDSIYFHDPAAGPALYVNQFVASTVDWAAKRVRVRQATAFPEEAGTRLEIRADAPTRFALRLRHPAWCARLSVRLNGRELVESTDPARYVTMERVWHDGDVLEVALPMGLHLQALPGAPDVAAVMLGPLVLAARLGREGMRPGDDIVVSQYAYGAVLDTPAELPRLRLDGRTLDEAVQPAGAPLRWRTSSAASGREIELAPFHHIAHERYSLYWQLAHA